MSVNTSITGAVVVLVVLMLIAGAVLGLALSDTDVFNPYNGRAEANRMNVEAEYEAQVQTADLEYYRTERAAQAAAVVEQYRQEVEFRRRQQEQELANQLDRQGLELALYKLGVTVLLAVGALALLVVGGGAAYYFVSLGRAAQHRRQDPWRSPEWRRAMRQVGQYNEIWQRYRRAGQSEGASATVGGGNGRGDPLTVGRPHQPRAGGPGPAQFGYGRRER